MTDVYLNHVQVEGHVLMIDEKVTPKQTKLWVMTLEHRKQGSGQLRTPWFWVFLTEAVYLQHVHLMVRGRRILVTGSLDTTSYEKPEGVKQRRTYIDAHKLEALT